MKKILISVLCCLLGCGNVYVSSTGGGSGGFAGENNSGGMATSAGGFNTGGNNNGGSSGGFGGEPISSANSGGIGGMMTSSSSSETTTSTTSSTLQTVDIQLNNSCDFYNVVVPAQNYVDWISATCFVPYSWPTVVSGFEYGLYGGNFNGNGCAENDHNAVWFVTDVKLDSPFPANPALTEVPIKASDLLWQDTLVKLNTTGPVARVRVDLDTPLSLDNSKMFCFGHRITFNGSKPTCDLACDSDVNLWDSQISFASVSPFQWKAVHDIPNGPSINFVANVFVEK